MKQFITAPILAEMLVLATFTANCIQYTEKQKHKQKQAKNKALSARRAILKKVHTEDFSEMQIYEAANDYFEKYYSKYPDKGNIIFLCRETLRVYLNKYAFGDSFYNLFKKLHKNSELFQRSFDVSEKTKIDFIKELKSLTQTSSLEIR